MLSAWRVFFALVGKDLRTELRAGRLVVSTLALGILLFLVVGIALNAVSNLTADWSAGLLWMVTFFATSIGMSRNDVKEQELGGQMGSFVAPIDRSLIFYAKWLSTWLIVLLATVGMLVAYFVILNSPAPRHPIDFLLVVMGGTLGLTGIGSFLAQLAGASTLRDILVPLLLFPMTIPLFIALIRLTVITIAPVASGAHIWVEVLLGYLILFGIMPFLLYETMMEV